ncbi:MAG: DNA repair protein RecN [Alphaproteobacteria bacterium]|jgi:DNA repair protein RecN (Recombination protein N)|nr:DNA repair protein RecN [Alphaproteobacteria bacterium]MDP6516894.1 DNA repair protein RecN [Alphaproteobacteria bacterium]
MLARLSVRDVVLIDRLDLDLGAGLCVLTGETGAGKSILLDALGLALGRRGDAALVRAGAERAVVSATFDIAARHTAQALLADRGLAVGDETLVLRRTLGADGRSRGFVNDQPVTIGFLAELGACLVEIYGQDDRLGLLSPTTHRAALDTFGHLDAEAEATAEAFDRWRILETELAGAERSAAAAANDRDELLHAWEALETLAPKVGEEQELTETRAFLRDGEAITGALDSALQSVAGDHPVDDALRTAQRHIAGAAGRAGGRLGGLVAAFERAAIEATEAIALLEAAGFELDLEPARLERVEERLFALRAAARKHDVAVDALVQLHAELAARLAALDTGDEAMTALRHRTAAAHGAFADAARTLTVARATAAGRLDAAITAELDDLKLTGAQFRTALVSLPEPDWGRAGAERVAFEVATNRAAAMPIQRVASGGELSRFMLALRVVTAAEGDAGCMIFDEIDSGIGGAVADAVGARLARLGRRAQVLVVTHQAQIAARAGDHFRVAKRDNGSRARTGVARLAEAERHEEIARMLAGADITDQARAAAASLIAECHGP